MSSSTLEHFSHPEHPLILKVDVVIGVDAKCYVCDKPVIGSPTYTCTSSHNYTVCQNFYLHKTCAELPTQINHHTHTKHPLTLLPAPRWICDLCYRDLKFGYKCDDCEFSVCVLCAFEERSLCHPGHVEHTLLLMQRESLFTCDACYEEAKDSSYVCTTCQFWIHKTCAISPFIIPDPTYHHHPLNLIYSIPYEHRYFQRDCAICKKKVHTNFWMYYCHKCTYFVHMKCATSSDAVSMANEIEADGVDNDPDLVQFPLPSEMSSSTLEHFSHPEHPLILKEDVVSGVDAKCYVCDKPVIGSPTYTCTSSLDYTVCQNFYLHKTCAELPTQINHHKHSKHPLTLLPRPDRYFCDVCHRQVKFAYTCDGCKFDVCVLCAFVQRVLCHPGHEEHTLTLMQRESLFMCDACYVEAKDSSYVCITCDFCIHKTCAFSPSTIPAPTYHHHPLNLIYSIPDIHRYFRRYCAICSKLVHTRFWMYYCHKCTFFVHMKCATSTVSMV